MESSDEQAARIAVTLGANSSNVLSRIAKR
ncbi:Uncharacterised protein [Vibrio cholerae]|nr:Uncharacterised protein [Vibrio cholerae]CSC19245.1 Uncharacterised protein [Vibrio cholerae]